jgi:hypothetical protein
VSTSISTSTTRHQPWCDVAQHTASAEAFADPGLCSGRPIRILGVSLWLLEDDRTGTAGVVVDTVPAGPVLTPAQARELAANLQALADVAQSATQEPPCPSWCHGQHSGRDLMYGERDHSCSVLSDEAASIHVSRLDRRTEGWGWDLGEPRIFCRAELYLRPEQAELVADALARAHRMADAVQGHTAVTP